MFNCGVYRAVVVVTAVSFTLRPSIKVMQRSLRDNIHSAQCFAVKECELQCSQHLYNHAWCDVIG